MTRAVREVVLIGALAIMPAPALAQLGELQVGVLANYGTGEAFGPGGGVAIGIATGRIAYMGLRWTSHMGTTTLLGPSGSPTEVRNRVQVFTADLGIMLPAGPLDVVAEISLGAVRSSQRARQTTPTPSGAILESSSFATEFLAAPGVSAEVHAGRVALIPELQYYLAGNPDLQSPVRHRGFVASVRLVVLFEVGRITH